VYVRVAHRGVHAIQLLDYKLTSVCQLFYLIKGAHHVSPQQDHVVTALGIGVHMVHVILPQD
jgi:hypothetical protein